MIGQLAAKKYVIVGRISKGGMGAVYRALQLPVEREVAFKVLRTEVEDSSQSRDRFVREARAVSRLTHSNIITLYDFGFQANGQPYMVMEYAPGVSLAQWLLKKDLTFGRVMGVCRQLLSALAEAHERGIVHRDLKPENMIITRRSSGEEELKLLDFGIARMINETSTRGLTREGEVFGTPHYMAPEQAQGAKEVGPRADIYAVGIMLYELITGQAPYDAPTPLAVLLMHINEPLPPITPRQGMMVPPGFAEVVQKAVAKNPDDRYQTATEMLYATAEWHSPSMELRHSAFAPPQLSPPGQPEAPEPLGQRVEVGQLYDPAGSSSAERPSYETTPAPTRANSKKVLWAGAAILLLVGGVTAALFAMDDSLAPVAPLEGDSPAALEPLKTPSQVMVQHREPTQEASKAPLKVEVPVEEPQAVPLPPTSPAEPQVVPIASQETKEAAQKEDPEKPPHVSKKPKPPRKPVADKPVVAPEAPPKPEVTKWGVDAPAPPKKPKAVVDKW